MSLNGKPLWDLGVIVDQKLNMSRQCDTANIAPGCMDRRVVSQTRDVLLPLCSALVGPQWESCVQFWDHI